MRNSRSSFQPVGRVLLDTYDPDEARELVSNAYCPHTLSVKRGSIPFHARQDEVSVGAISLHRLGYGATTEVAPEALESWILVSTPISGRLNVTSGEDGRILGPGESVVLDAFRKFRLTFDDDCLLRTFRFERKFLEQTLGDIHGVDGPLQARFGLTGPTSPRGAGTWQAIANLLIRESAADNRQSAHPLLQHQLARTAVIALSETHPFVNLSDSGTVPVPSPRTVKRVIDIVEANPEHPFTVAELAAAAGVGVRALQEAFRRYLGTTPMGFVRDVRLRKAHEELTSGSPATVAVVAYRWGFGNLGRFATSYREKYGRLPSLTLRR